ncbi:IS3 family transposase [Thermoanaerobacterium sp. RBIITD]|uniref:IS3 family transposase n=1 Tax=Thermoanaerobacterium sp. RBIITD TaxID=1550240 RepID=UPI000BB799CA|nr:IS3 family transposase [Thermoanaerobacterium sp. RBIITD]
MSKNGIRYSEEFKQVEADKLKAEIKRFTESRCRYGAPKIQKVLKDRGKHISLKRIQRY